MKGIDPCQAYINLAEGFVTKRIYARDLSKFTLRLPPLDEILLKDLGERSEKLAINDPRRGWALANIVYTTANTQNQSLFVRSMAAWQLGRAANHWGQPKRVAVAISRARQGFEKLNETGWLAACDWQYFVLSWTRPNIPQAVKILKQALIELQRAKFETFVPQCRLALAYAQLLIDRFDQARENIRVSEAFFTANGDHLNRARCWLNEASCLRREHHVDDAMDKLEVALGAFEKEKAPIDRAKAHYQLALCHLIISDDLSEASSQFTKAIEIFSNNGMDLWKALCTSNLGYVHLLTGSLGKADRYFAQARKSFARHQVIGMLADNLNDTGKLNTLRGFSTASVEQFKQAEQLHENLGLKIPAAIDTANLGEAYGYMGRYQDALYHLERAAAQLKLARSFFRLGSCEKSMALVWGRLGRPDIALEHLNKAAAYHKKTNEKALLSSDYNYRASILFSLNRHGEAIEFLRKSLDIALKNKLRPQAALARRLLGDALSRFDNNAKAFPYLRKAHDEFAEIGMVMEQAATLVAMGNYYVQINESDKARSVLKEALRLSAKTMPEIEWRSYSVMAALAESQGENQAELLSYQQASEALRNVRQNFWQPSLAGSYLQASSDFIDKALVRIAEIGSPNDVLQFVEQNKAQTLIVQLVRNLVPIGRKRSHTLDHLRSEINWIQDKLRISFDQSNLLQSAKQSRKLRARLIEKAKLYDSLLSRIERKSLSDEDTPMFHDSFDQTAFFKLAKEALGKSWFALDYFLTGTRLITVVMTPDEIQIHNTSVSKRFLMALEACTRQQQHLEPSPSDLRILGDVLIPNSVAERLSPDSYLLLAPHRKLHGIPWAAIEPAFTSKPLMRNCIPCVVPSLHSLGLLWERNRSNRNSNRENGLVIGVSTFHGVYRELPQVKQEVAELSTKLDSKANFLVESDATWKNLSELMGQAKHSHQKSAQHFFPWLHIATHFFADSQTGRLSGVTLWDGNVWLDQLQDLSPLPDMLTFSACNSIFSFIYEGDEHLDLPTTCFIAGSNRIIGSAWPILDQSAAKFTNSFYDNFLRGMSPAKAVTLVQRQMEERGERINNWASFMCMGVP